MAGNQERSDVNSFNTFGSKLRLHRKSNGRFSGLPKDFCTFSDNKKSQLQKNYFL